MDKPGLLVIGPYPDADLAALAEDFSVFRLWQAKDPAALVAEVGPRVRAIGTRGELGADAALMAALPALEIVACYGVGVDAIDLDYARAHDIRVTNTPDVLTEDVADMGIALLLATARRIVAGDAHVRDGAWPAGAMALTTRVWGKRLGIVGLGRIGRAVARRAEGFGMTIAYCDPRRVTEVSYTWHPDPVALAREVDFLIVCAAGGADTRSLIGAAVLEALGPVGMWIIISRGSVVDEPALLAALRERRIAAAGLDVFLNEPRIDAGFRALDNVVLQPHNSSGTRETRAAMGRLVRDNLLAHFAGGAVPTPVI